MERRMRWKSHVRCGVGENLEIVSKSYLSLSVIPTVIASGYENLYETYQVGWGDNAKYTVESNEMFVVNDIAEGIARGGVQTSYNTEYTVQARPKQVSVYVDWLK